MSWTTGLQVTREKRGALPIWIDDIKDHLQIDTDDHDLLLNTLMGSAVETVEQYCSVSLIETNVTASWDELHTTEELPYGPVRSVINAEECSVKGVVPGWAKVFGNGHAARCEYVAGYDNIPDPIKLAVMKLVTDNFEQRAGFTMSGRLTMMQFPNDWRSSLRPYRRRTFLS